MRRIYSLGAIILAIGLGLVLGPACKSEKAGKEPSTPSAQKPSAEAPTTPAAPDRPATEKKEIYRFAIIAKSKQIPVFDYAKIGAQRMAERYGNVEIIWDSPDTTDPVRQKKLVDKYVDLGVDGIALSCLNAEALTPAINRAAEKGIPVVTFDSDAPDSKRTAFYGVNDFETGVVMAQELSKLMGPAGGKVVVLTNTAADNLSKRLEGALSVIHQHPELQVVKTENVEDDPDLVARVIESVARTYPDLRGLLSLGGWPAFATNILDPIDAGKTFVISFDTIPPAPDIIRAGKIHLAIGQKYFGWGAESVRLLYEIVVEKKLPEHPFVNSGYDTVTPKNVDEYSKKWKKMEAGEIIE